jgi:hypothetical protein
MSQEDRSEALIDGGIHDHAPNVHPSAHLQRQLLQFHCFTRSLNRIGVED